MTPGLVTVIPGGLVEEYLVGPGPEPALHQLPVLGLPAGQQVRLLLLLVLGLGLGPVDSLAEPPQQTVHVVVALRLHDLGRGAAAVAVILARPTS